MLIIMSGIVIAPFITPLLTSVCLAYIFYPIYTRLNRRIRHDSLSAFLVTGLIILVFTVPIIFAINGISQEALNIYASLSKRMSSGEILSCDSDFIVCGTINRLKEVFEESHIKEYMWQGVNKSISYVISRSSDFLLSLPRKILELFVMIFVIFYLLKDGKYLVEKFWRLFPLKKRHRTNVIKQVSDVTYAVIYGAIIAALVQGALGTIGLMVVGVRGPILWGIIMAFCALLPIIGTALIWGPISAYITVMGILGSDMIMIFKGVGLFLYGLLVISSIDNIIRPKIIGKKAKVHPAIILMGVLGGLAVFGFVGIMVGPLILALLITFLNIYEKEKT
ncbi:MAG: AI-2E family transporter [archaeon]